MRPIQLRSNGNGSQLRDLCSLDAAKRNPG